VGERRSLASHYTLTTDYRKSFQGLIQKNQSHINKLSPLIEYPLKDVPKTRVLPPAAPRSFPAVGFSACDASAQTTIITKKHLAPEFEDGITIHSSVMFLYYLLEICKPL